MQDLKERTIRGGSARALALAANFLIRVGSLTVLARLLEPRDFGFQLVDLVLLMLDFRLHGAQA